MRCKTCWWTGRVANQEVPGIRVAGMYLADGPVVAAMKRQYSSVSVDVIRHLRSENERLLTAARQAEARLQQDPVGNRSATMLELSHGLRNHLALVEGLLDALTLDHPTRRGSEVASEPGDDHGGPGNTL